MYGPDPNAVHGYPVPAEACMVAIEREDLVNHALKETRPSLNVTDIREAGPGLFACSRT